MIRLIALVIVVVGLAVLAQMTGLIHIDTSGTLRPPAVDLKVSGGQVPDVQVETAKVKVGVEEKSVELPKVDVGMQDRAIKLPDVEVQKAADDGTAR
jgi:hypothetical protein